MHGCAEGIAIDVLQISKRLTPTSSRIRVIKSAQSFCAPATLSISLPLKSARSDMSGAPKNGGIAHANALVLCRGDSFACAIVLAPYCNETSARAMAAD